MSPPKKLVICSLTILVIGTVHAGLAGADDTVSFGTGGYASALRSKATMRMMDTNKDEKVSRNEWMDYEERIFAAMDTNKDGVLDKKEFVRTDNPAAAFATAAYARGLMTDETLIKIDVDHDGTISRDEFIAYHKMIFDKLDKHKKGSVGLVDFIQPAS